MHGFELFERVLRGVDTKSITIERYDSSRQVRTPGRRGQNPTQDCRRSFATLRSFASPSLPLITTTRATTKTSQPATLPPSDAPQESSRALLESNEHDETRRSLSSIPLATPSPHLPLPAPGTA
jgi:hypothetical protein